MKELLKTLLIEPFTEREIISFVIGTIGWVLFLGVVISIFCVIGFGINIIGRSDESGVGVVCNKTFVPEHQEVSGKTIHFVNDSWYLNIKKDNLHDIVKVSYSFYNTINVSDSLKIKYYTGRLYHSLYIKSINK